MLTNLVAPASASAVHYAILWITLLAYALSWEAIGWSLRAGDWLPEEPAASA